MSAVVSDLIFLANRAKAFGEYEAATILDWIQIISRCPKGFKKNLQAAKSEHGVNDIQAWAKTNKLAEVNTIFQCDSCNFSCCTRQQLALHSFRVHGAWRRLRDYIDTDFCPVCLQMFHSRIKVINHIEEKSLRCRLVVCTTFSKPPPEIIAAMDDEDAQLARALAKIGRRRHHKDIYVERMAGPLTRGAIIAGLSHRTLLKTPSALLDDNVISRLVACR